VIIGLVYILLPFMVMPLYSSIEKLDKPLLEAAKIWVPVSCRPLSALSFR
jgi:ABC-type spermidine/putrescine transport system permease subunit I